MGTLVTDVESVLKGRCAMDWALANGVNLKFKAPRQKAWIVEHHNEILHGGLHGSESQLKREALVATFEQVLAIVRNLYEEFLDRGEWQHSISGTAGPTACYVATDRRWLHRPSSQFGKARNQCQERG